MFRCRVKRRETSRSFAVAKAKSRQSGEALAVFTFPRCPSPFRLGITLTEVLISLGILTIGLLGVAALFPVGSYYMQRGETADFGSALAQAAFNEVAARGMLEPSSWLMPEPDGFFVTYTRRFQDGLRNEVAAQVTATNALQRNQVLNGKYGYAYVIDPLAVNGSPRNPSSLVDRAQVRETKLFPFNAKFDDYAQSAWWPWNPGSVNSSDPSWPRWPVMRVTLPQSGGPTSPSPLTTEAAERLFISSDDLAFELPDRADRPSIQRWELANLDGGPSGTADDPLSRQSQGNYSWIVTVVPPNSDARNALATNPSAYEYEVSVAVFYKRIIDNFMTDTTTSERLVGAKVVSTGLNGGELLLAKLTGDNIPDPFGALKTGNWVVVCGPHPASSNELPRFVLRWYRVLSIEGKDTKLNSQGNESPAPNPGEPERRLVALRGPQWPWQPARGLDAAYNYELSNVLCVAIVPNVVAVHSKTMRLEGTSPWSTR